jgi:hypothetical protein
MQRSLVKSESLFQPSYVRLNFYDRQYRCEKQIPYDIRGKSKLLLDPLGALCNLLRRCNRVVNLRSDQLCS